MNRYSKAWVAVAGALAQIAVVLDQALDAGALPASWVPWVRVGLALATAVGVYAVRNTPAPVEHVYRRGDTGSARTLLVALVGFALAGLLVVATLLAGPAEAHRRTPLHVDVNDARVCSSTLLVAFDLEQLVAREWTFRQDDGAAVLQLRHHGAAAGPAGHWETVTSTSGGEGHLRAQVGGLPYWDAVRVVHRGIVSSPRLPVECTA